MDKFFLDVATLWGAGLSTILAFIHIRSALRDRAVVKVFTDLLFKPVDKQSPEYGTRLISKERDIESVEEVSVEISIANHGRRAVQIVSIFVDYKNGKLHQITGRNLPAVIEPGCRITSTIQKEWLDDPNAIGLGALDALGKRHAPPKPQIRDLIDRCRALPSNRRQYIKKDSPDAPPVWAWQIRDPSTLSLSDKVMKVSQSVRDADDSG
jgi:hypothetical protein